MKKIFSTFLLAIIAVLFTGTLSSHADETLGTLSLTNPDLSKVVTIKKGEELRFRFEVKDARTTCWVFVSNLNKRYLEGSALSIDILDEKGNIINSSGFTYITTTHGITITGYDLSEEDEDVNILKIPETIDGKQYEIHDYANGWADEPKKIIIDSESKSGKKKKK